MSHEHRVSYYFLIIINNFDCVGFVGVELSYVGQSYAHKPCPTVLRRTVLRRVSIMFFILRHTSYHSALRLLCPMLYLKPYTQKSFTVHLMCLELMIVSPNMASILTTSNGVTLVYNGRLYYKNRTTQEKIHWRCSLRS